MPMPSKVSAVAAIFWHGPAMLDGFDRKLLDQVQVDDGLTAEQLAEQIPLSPSAIARRLRRLRGEGLIARTIALLAPALTEGRLRALVTVQLNEHADRRGKEQLLARLRAAEEVQFAYEITGSDDLAVLVDCPRMERFVDLAEALFAADSTVRRYETSFIKRELKFAPFVRLS